VSGVVVTFAESALKDLEEILSWYESEYVPEVGARLVAELVEHAADLSDHPDIGRVVPEFGRKNLRELVHAPFRVVYKREKYRVRIVRVWRSERLLRLPDEPRG
jgi:plasmid stabilization system protein ParE